MAWLHFQQVMNIMAKICILTWNWTWWHVMAKICIMTFNWTWWHGMAKFSSWKSTGGMTWLKIMRLLNFQQVSNISLNYAIFKFGHKCHGILQPRSLLGTSVGELTWILRQVPDDVRIVDDLSCRRTLTRRCLDERHVRHPLLFLLHLMSGLDKRK
jgi:hypothetical protein